MRKKIKVYYLSINRVSFLFFLNGICVSLLVFFQVEDTYEKNLFSSLAANAAKAVNSESTDKSIILLSCLHLVHNAMQSRHQFFSNIEGLKAEVIQPVSVDLMTGQGACGSYALVLARLLQNFDFKVRMAQMKVDKVYGRHHVIEAELDGRWVVLDPLYDLYFKSENNRFASFKEVGENWKLYKEQVPAGYNFSYQYEDVRYTNWDKIPILMPAIKKLLDWTIGEEKADAISLRILVLRKFYIFFRITFFVQLMLISYTVYYSFKKSKLAASRVENEQNKADKVTVRILNSHMENERVHN